MSPEFALRISQVPAVRQLLGVAGWRAADRPGRRTGRRPGIDNVILGRRVGRDDDHLTQPGQHGKRAEQLSEGTANPVSLDISIIRIT
ncbi:MAG TPA: hypothetical protein VFQ44_09205 [Streptosporangiaceae bacterium]|nr:hypothetical protein [Streptosporangiaceae bacterium]